jgi:hypothetical protein
LEDTTSVELAKQSGSEYRSVRLHMDREGGIRLDAHDMGPTVTQVFDRDDYEYAVEVPAAAVARLAFELLRDRFAGNIGAVDELRKLCEERGISFRFETWP